MKGVCQSCRQQKYEVHARKSELLPEMNLLMCKTCIRKGFEPRHIIILAARSGRLKQASRFIVSRKYEGATIPASDILLSG